MESTQVLIGPWRQPNSAMSEDLALCSDQTSTDIMKRPHEADLTEQGQSRLILKHPTNRSQIFTFLGQSFYYKLLSLRLIKPSYGSESDPVAGII